MKLSKGAQADVESLQLVKGRLEGEVGTIIELVLQTYLKGGEGNYFSNGGYPYWSSIRMLLPVAESIGALLYDDTSIKNLKRLFEENLGQPRYDVNYRILSEILILLFRHPLIHSDEMRSIIDNGVFIGWGLISSEGMNHLRVIKHQGIEDSYSIQFNPRMFYDHLILLLDDLILQAKDNKWNGLISKKYEKWKQLDLTDKSTLDKLGISSNKLTTIRKEIGELEKLSQRKDYVD